MYKRIARKQTRKREYGIRLRVTGHAAPIQREDPATAKLNTGGLRICARIGSLHSIAHTLDAAEKLCGVHTQGCIILYGPALRIIFMGGNGERRSSLPTAQLQFPILFVLRIKAKCQFPFKMGAGFHYILCPLKNEGHIIALSRKLRYEPCFKIRGCQCAAIVFDADRDLLQNRDRTLFRHLTDRTHGIRERAGVYGYLLHAAFLLDCFSNTVCMRIVLVEKSV